MPGPSLGLVLEEHCSHAGITGGDAWPSGVSSCFPCPFQPYSKAKTGRGWDGPTNLSGLYHCKLHTRRTRHILGKEVLWRGRACTCSLQTASWAPELNSELLTYSASLSSHTSLVPCPRSRTDSPSTSLTSVGETHVAYTTFTGSPKLYNTVHTQ